MKEYQHAKEEKIKLKFKPPDTGGAQRVQKGLVAVDRDDKPAYSLSRATVDGAID